MSLLEEAMIESEEFEGAAQSFNPPLEEEEVNGFRFEMPDFSFLLKPTGEGSIENYMNDPLNFDGKKSTARILRGATGLLGALNYAIIDIGLGVLEKMREKKNEAADTEE